MHITSSSVMTISNDKRASLTSTAWVIGRLPRSVASLTGPAAPGAGPGDHTRPRASVGRSDVTLTHLSVTGRLRGLCPFRRPFLPELAPAGSGRCHAGAGGFLAPARSRAAATQGAAERPVPERGERGTRYGPRSGAYSDDNPGHD